jgi:hypothetical protein
LIARTSAARVERFVPGIDCALAELDDDLAPTGTGYDLRQRLEFEPADKIEQRLMVGASAGDLNALVAQAAQEQRTRSIEAVKLGDIEPARWSLLRPFAQRSLVSASVAMSRASASESWSPSPLTTTVDRGDPRNHASSPQALRSRFVRRIAKARHIG